MTKGPPWEGPGRPGGPGCCGGGLLLLFTQPQPRSGGVRWAALEEEERERALGSVEDGPPQFWDLIPPPGTARTLTAVAQGRWDLGWRLSLTGALWGRGGLTWVLTETAGHGSWCQTAWVCVPGGRLRPEA